jgi:hypothetical protein
VSIEFNCPECQATIHVSEQLAGLHTRCPECSTSIPVPDGSAGGYTPSTAAGSAPPSRRDWEPPSSRYSDYDAPVRYAGGGWDVARYGLTMEFIAVVIFICAMAASILIQCLTSGMMGGMRGGGGPGGGPGAGMLMVGLGFLLLGAVVVSAVLVVIARFLCCAAPSTGGLKGLAIGSAIALCMALLSFVAMFLLIGLSLEAAIGGRMGRGDQQAMLTGLLALGMLLLITTAHILYMIFLRNTAVSFGNRDLGTRCVIFLVFSLVLPVLYVVAVVFLAMMASRGGNPAGLHLFSVIALWVLILVLLGWYSNLVGQVRDTVTQGRRSSRGDWR